MYFYTCVNALFVGYPDPRFVSVYLIPESDNSEDDKIYLFFRENAIDGEQVSKATHARIGQLCKVRRLFKIIYCLPHFVIRSYISLAWHARPTSRFLGASRFQG